MPTAATSNITDWHADYATRHNQWLKIRDAIEGEDKIKDQGESYLPKPSGMNPNEYKAYKTRASFFPVAERTLRGMTGLVFRHEAKLEMPARLEPMRDALTTDGYSYEVLTEEILREVLSVGRYGMLLDFAVENADSGAVPYIATYFAEDIINWEQQFHNGQKILTRLVLRDDIDNTFGQDVVQYLELILNDEGHYEVRKWQAQVTDAKGDDRKKPTQFVITETLIPKVGGKPLTEIPFVFVNTYDLRPDLEKPPMLDLVHVNLAHYRNSADYEHALYLTAQPTPWVAGQINENNRPTAIGSGTIWILPEGAQAGMLEFTGSGIEAQKNAMEDKENRMASLGARMIHEGRNRNEASDTARMRGRSELSLLTNAVNMAQAGLERIFRMAANWTGTNPEEIEVKLNRDWIETRLDAQELTALTKAWQSGAISHKTLHDNLQRGEIMPMDREYEEEKELIEEEGGDLGLGINQLLSEAAQQPPADAAQRPASQPTQQSPGETE